jgi:hypothetical protein
MTYDPLSIGAQSYMAVAREIAIRGSAVNPIQHQEIS